ncbi:hypothetical protein [Blautia sp.]
MHTVNKKLTQALGYCQNQKKYLETFLEDGRIPLSNGSTLGSDPMKYR